jgi:hypothetical protein
MEAFKPASVVKSVPGGGGMILLLALMSKKLIMPPAKTPVITARTFLRIGCIIVCFVKDNFQFGNTDAKPFIDR